MVVGEPVAAIGSPFGQESSLSVGVVSATERSIDSITSGFNLVDAIQTDAPINRGNSGGPMFDADGDVIGINAQIRSESGTAEGVGFAVPINAARRSMEQLIQTGEGALRLARRDHADADAAPRRALRLPAGRAARRCSPSPPAALPTGPGFAAASDETEFEGIAFCPGGDLIVAVDGKPVALGGGRCPRCQPAALPGRTRSGSPSCAAPSGST